MSLDLFLDELNANMQIGTAGTFIGKNFVSIGSTDATLYYQTPVDNWRPLFLFKTDGITDVTGEEVALATAQGLNFLGTADASGGGSVTTGLYTPSTVQTGSDNFTNYVINDSSVAGGSLEDPACKVDFLAELSRGIFGTPLGIDMLTNEAEIAADYEDTINSLANTINQSFATTGSSTMLSNINELSAIKLRVCKKLYQQLRYSQIARFTLKYQSAVTSSAFSDGISIPVYRTPKGSSAAAVLTGATVDVAMTGSTIDNLMIRDVSNVFLDDDKVTISHIGPAFRAYKASDSTTIGAAIVDDAGGNAYTPGGGFMWNTSSTAFQINLLRNSLVTAYTTADPPAGSVEYWNGDRTAAATGDMSGGNWVDPEAYALLINEDGSMNVYTNGGATISEIGTQWTITGWGQTVLRGTLTKENITVDGANVEETTLHVQDREYRKFSADICANMQESFTGQMYTEVEAYKFRGTLGVGTALTVVIDTTPTGPVGVQLGAASETMEIAQINSVQQAILNGNITSDTQLPIEANDVFNLVMKVSNNAAQLNVAGKVLDTIGDTVTRSIKLKVKLGV